MASKLADELKVEMLPEGTCRDIAEKIGVPNLLKVTDIVGGTCTYFPRTEGFLRVIRNRRIKHEFTGGNYRELSKKYGLSERYIRQICTGREESNVD